MGPDCGARSMYGPPECVPPGGRAAMTKRPMVTDADEGFLYVTVPFSVPPAPTLLLSSFSGETSCSGPVITGGGGFTSKNVLGESCQAPTPSWTATNPS